MTKFQTIQKVAEDMGIDSSYLRTMIKNKDLIAYRKDGYKRIYINIDELNSTIKPIDEDISSINLDDFLI